MPRRRARGGREEILVRWVRVESVGFGLFRRAERGRGEPASFDSRSYLELRGEADEPLGQARRFAVHVHVDDREEAGTSIPPAIGCFIRLAPEADAVVSVDSASFDRLWSLAAANLLRHCRLAFTRPYRRSSMIVSASFSNEGEE